MTTRDKGWLYEIHRIQVAHTLKDEPGQHDVDGIVDEVVATYGYIDVGEIPAHEYKALVNRHRKENADRE